MIRKWLASEHSALDYLFIAIGAFIQALSMRLFLIPGLMVSGGISGAAQIINFFTRWPIGVMVLLGNLPLLVLGWQYLGGRRFALRTAVAVALFSLFTDSLAFLLPAEGVTHDVVLDAVYGGVMLGIGLGFVYRGRGTSADPTSSARSSTTTADRHFSGLSHHRRVGRAVGLCLRLGTRALYG